MDTTPNNNQSHEPASPQQNYTTDPIELNKKLDAFEAELDSLRRQLIESERLATLGTLASLIAHEFNNLMTPVVGYTSAGLKQLDNTEMVRKALEKARTGAKRASQIAESILRLSDDRRFVASACENPSCEPEPTFLAAVLCMAKDPAADGINIIIDNQAPDVRAQISPSDLQQCLLNLTLNARKAMLPMHQGGLREDSFRGGDLTITITSSTWNDAPSVIIAITDTGIGISKVRCREVFKPYVTGGNGSGLGLSLCKDLIEHAKGRISVESKLGQGSTFYVEIPTCPTDASEEDKAVA